MLKLQFTSPANEAYLRMWMKTPKNSKSIKLTANNIVGKMLISKLSYSKLPVRQSSGTDIILPKGRTRKAERHFCYYSVTSQIEINYYLEAMLDINFRYFMLDGEEIHIKNKAMYERFIELSKQRNHVTIYDQLKKAHYRSTKIRKEMFAYSIQQVDV